MRRFWILASGPEVPYGPTLRRNCGFWIAKTREGEKVRSSEDRGLSKCRSKNVIFDITR